MIGNLRKAALQPVNKVSVHLLYEVYYYRRKCSGIGLSYCSSIAAIDNTGNRSSDCVQKMEKERKMKTEEGKEEKTKGWRPESSSNKVNYCDMQPRCNYDSIFFIGLRKTSDFLFLATSSLWPDGCSGDLYTEEMFHLSLTRKTQFKRFR